MAKKKLARFAEMEVLPNVFQPKHEEVFRTDYSLKGKWGREVFHNDHPIILEIGCGKGEYTVELGKLYPEKNFIGLDIKGARMWKGAKTAVENGMNNVAFLRMYAEMLESAFAPGEIAEIWITFPDPQMAKARKRLSGTRFLTLYRKILAPQAVIHLKTDSPFLYRYTSALIELNRLPVEVRTEDLYGCGLEDKILSIKTFYEKQWLSRGKAIKYIRFSLGEAVSLTEPDIEIEKDDYHSEARYMNSHTVHASKKRVLMAMSGGIDSTVAAMLLLEQGYELVGVTYRTFDNISRGCMEKEKGCCSVDSLFEAKRMAQGLGFEHHILDIRQEFKDRVIANFIDEYLQGRTPNPCVVCNSTIKWGKLIETADEMGCDYIATGHYARIGRQAGRWYLRKGADLLKDQTYFLWTLTQENLSRTLFPLGGLTKPEVRQIAFNHGYEKLSKKGESQEICFIPDNDYRAFLAGQVENYSEKYGPGDFIDTSGKRLGEHKGYPNYTIGQRKGLGIALGQPMFVVAIHPEDNTVVLGTKEELQGKSFFVKEFNMMKYAQIPDGLEVIAKIRYRNEGKKAALYPEGNRLRVVFHETMDSITPGQSAVFYEGEDVVGGGVIENRE